MSIIIYDLFVVIYVLKEDKMEIYKKLRDIYKMEYMFMVQEGKWWGINLF